MVLVPVKLLLVRLQTRQPDWKIRANHARSAQTCMHSTHRTSNLQHSNRCSSWSAVSISNGASASASDCGRSVVFSPKELPAPDGDPSSSAQGHPMWVLRLGEFLQRRVNQAGAIMSPLMEARTSRPTQVSTRPPLMPPRSWSGGYQSGLFSPDAERTMQQWASQAPLLHGPPPQQGSESSTGSLTREQVLLEFQRQVSREMQAFTQQRTALEMENQRLREALERSQQAQHAQVMDHQEGRALGNSAGPQGSAFSGVVGDRGGNPVGPGPQASVSAGDPLGRQPDPKKHVYDPASELERSGVHQREPGAAREVFSVRDGAPGEVPSSFVGPRKDPLGILGGQGLQPSLHSWMLQVAEDD